MKDRVGIHRNYIIPKAIHGVASNRDAACLFAVIYRILPYDADFFFFLLSYGAVRFGKIR